jgi:putative flippase GtrA
MTTILTDTRERARFLRFIVVGTIGAVVDFTTFNLLNGLLHMPAVWAQAVSFTIAVISNFTWNRLWTYPDSRTKTMSRQLFQFFIVNAAGLGIRTPIFSGLEIPLRNLFTNVIPPIPHLSPSFLGHNFSLAVAVVVVMMWNFFVNRYWTYNDVK